MVKSEAKMANNAPKKIFSQKHFIAVGTEYISYGAERKGTEAYYAGET